MMTIDDIEEIKDENSKTKFYRSRDIPAIRKHACILLIFAVFAGALTVFGGIGAGARSALSDAKDIRVAMKLVSMENYGGDGSIYDPSTDSGLAPGALEKVHTMSRFKGDLVLKSWDSEKNIPLSFSYRAGKYLVEYKDTGSGDGSYGMNGSWSVYYDIKVLEYTQGSNK